MEGHYRRGVRGKEEGRTEEGGKGRSDARRGWGRHERPKEGE